MLRVRSRFPVGRVSQRRQTAWSVGTGGTGVTNIVSSTAVIIGATLTPVIAGLTLVRIRGFLDIYIDGASSADGDGFFGAFGIGIASLAAVTAGIGSVPTPITEQGSDNWLYHTFISVHDGDVSQAARGPETVFRTVIDSKAMRKSPVDIAMYAALEVVEIGTSGIDVFHDSRFLSKLS